MMPIDFNSLDTAIHGPIRLGILSALQIDGNLDFTTLKKRLEVADGALGIHLQKLQDAGYIHAQKSFVGKRPNTSYSLTTEGKKALGAYLEQMRRVIESVEAAETQKDAARRARSRRTGIVYRTA
jgi:DNA-binding PadR family transcriptional regulator